MKWPWKRRDDAVKRAEQERLLAEAKRMTPVYRRLAPTLPKHEMADRLRDAMTRRPA